MSKQTTFTLTLLVAVSAIVPGSAGYLSARMDAVEQARSELLSLESRLRQERHEELAEEIELVRQARRSRAAVPAPTPCKAMESSGQEHGRQPHRPTAIVPGPLERETERLLQKRIRGDELLEARLDEEITEEVRRLTELERRRKIRERVERLIAPGLSAVTERILPSEAYRRARQESPAPESPQPDVPAN
ncbi:hypothetical protein [Streptosporangium lutulentum]|uniref:Periplasmic heavy metal sensor n=1 Tax=Streptosporangium lutulentum TaxID=1461250 RepID=A0ABT9QKQ1_9ACTN|nr:hypothetical protein [Streptosporangium lutulentum]MDP9847335.1 hypothetical protein [Streptosporangium lutulentum]